MYACVKASRTRNVRIPSNKDATIAALEISHEIGISQPRVLEELRDDQLHPTPRKIQFCFQAIVLYECNFPKDYDVNTLPNSSFYVRLRENLKHFFLRVR
jgi:hypothetical protein